MESEKKIWKSVPLEKEKEWEQIFSQSREILHLQSACPICGKNQLYRYFHIHKKFELKEKGEYKGHGGLWEWCRNCQHYIHSSSFIPNWWKCDFEMDEKELFAEPSNLDLEITKFQNKKRKS